jgi:2-polyprenyl-6-methoxyphenol hydroxylase-like FAD-dependent oxidoreductase
LLAARVLSAHFDRVTVFDRDTLPEAGRNRPGVPQGRHGHGLLATGLRGLKTLFPSFEADVLRAGAVPGDVIGSLRWFQHGEYKAKFMSGLEGLLMSRPLLEGVIREHVLRIPNVRVLDRTRVFGLLADEGQVTGVRVQLAGERPRSQFADIVVDAAGRASRAPEWLEDLGYAVPAVEKVNPNIAYTTRTFRRRSEDLDGDMGAAIMPTPPRERRFGTILAMEGDRWMVGLGGWLGDHAPVDPEGYLAFARSLPRPEISQIVQRAEALTDAAYYPFPSSVRQRYERLSRFPGGYLVIGDAMCSFNPLYGQGMSVAVLEALALEACLERAVSTMNLWRPYFKAASRVIDGPWTIAVGGDLAFQGVTGARPAGADIINWYLRHVHHAAASDQVVCRAFFDVANLLKPAGSLFRPSVILRVAREALFSRVSRPASAGRGRVVKAAPSLHHR